jgi:uncharacterized peroxidase-related enzyme
LFFISPEVRQKLKQQKQKIMKTFNVPTREEVGESNQQIFDNLKSQLGFVPNLYATMAYSDTALGNYLQLQQSKTSLSNKEKEVVNLVVSQGNNCTYCQSAHTAISKMNGFTDDQILELRSGKASFNEKFDALVKLASEINLNRGQVSESTLENFFNAGYSKGTLVDVVVAIADKVVMNYLHNLTQVPVDFPIAQELDTVEA